ncbi:MAG: sugar ABC transporter substrate-binding protein [Chloroflexi bacterium]|nr:sugar ABC transporter substrate-binding protein [Chloroflexota bacterium]
MKRVRTLAAVGVVAASLAIPAGAGAQDPSDGLSGSLSIAYWNYGPAAEVGNQVIADGFMAENPGVTVTLTPIAGENWGAYYANLATTIASGQRPDIAFTASEGIKFLAQNDLVVPINEFLANDPEAAALQADIAPALLQSFAYGDQITALPYGWNNMIVYYNKAVFDAAGVAYPSVDWTWADFRETAQQLTADTDGDGNNDRYGFAWASNEIFPGILPWVANAGGNLVNDDVSAPTANSPEVVEAVTFLKGLLDDGIAATPSPMGDIFTGFQNGSIAMFGAGRWPSATFLNNGFDDWDIQYYPTGTTRQTVAGAGAYAILRSAPDPNLAWELQKYTVSEPVQDSLIGTPDAPRDSIPTLRSTAGKTVAAGIPPANGAIFYGSVDDYPTLTPFPAPAKYSEYESTVLRNLQLIFAGEVPVQEGLDTLQSELVAVVGG